MSKYIALGLECEERINWACGARLGDVSRMYCPDCHSYVSIWTSDGSMHTVLGNNLKEMQERCYEEFMAGERNNIPPCSYKVKKKKGWLGKFL